MRDRTRHKPEVTDGGVDGSKSVEMSMTNLTAIVAKKGSPVFSVDEAPTSPDSTNMVGDSPKGFDEVGGATVCVVAVQV